MPFRPHNLRPRAPRAGFTFIEVMFAVMILGFGVIMIAAMLPVALRQTQTARESVAGSAACEGGFHTLEAAWANRDKPGVTIYGLPGTYQNATNTNFPAFAGAVPEASTFPAYRSPAETANVPLFLATLGDRVGSADPATAFIPFYLGDGSGTPLVTLLGVGARNVPALSDPDADATVSPFLLPGQFFVNADNCPLPVEVTMVDGSTQVGSGPNARFEQVDPNRLILAGRAGVSNPQVAQAAVEGAAVVLRDEKGRLRALRLSKPVDDSGLVWELTPAGGFAPDEARLTNPANRGSNPRTDVVGYLVGRMLKNPGAAWDDADNAYVGSTQVTQVLESQRLP